jgi:RHS repeat-associated protein
MHGRLAQIDDNGKLVTYKYNSKNQLVEQVINGIPVHYTYTQFGQLEGKYMGSKERPIAFLKYTYDNDGMITARNVNGANQLYTYDLKGQLTSVTQDGKVVESYTYDPAGNILKKVVAGKTTEFTYDAANQLASMTENSGEAGNNAVRRTDFAYDAAGRMTQQIHGEAGTDAVRRTEYAYGWMNKVMSISENGKVSATYDYHIDGQVAKRLGTNGKAQNFFWDGLALIRRGETNLTNEPYVTGGNPIIANDTTLFNDILGTTQGYVSSGEASTNAPSRTGDGKEFAAISRDSFGQTLDNSTDTNYDYFTGKPKVEGLGYAFLFRNYAAGLGKWTTSDPLGYPDGWNNFAYVNNCVNMGVDPQGLSFADYSDNLTKLRPVDITFLNVYYSGGGNKTLSYFGLQSAMEAEVVSQGIISRFTKQTDAVARGLAQRYQHTGSFTNSFSNSYNFVDVAYSLGNGALSGSFSGNMTTYHLQDNPNILTYGWSGVVTLNFSDSFTDPLSIIEKQYGSSSSPDAPSWLVSLANLGGTPYSVTGTWQVSISGSGIIE